MDFLNNLFQSKKRILIIGILLTCFFASIIFIIRGQQTSTVDAAFSKYIESYTAGIISKESTIKIRLANNVVTSHTQNDQLADDIFDFSPSIKGKTFWIDARTIVFKPDNKLDPDKNYKASFKLGKLIKVASNFETFKFNFQTIKPDFTVTFNGLQTATNYSTDKMKLTGSIQTADDEDPTAIEKILKTDFSTPVNITWQHNSLTKTHTPLTSY